MNPEVKDLLSYYNRQPDPILIRKTFAIFGMVPEEKHKEVIDWIIDHIPKKNGIDILTIKNAISEMGLSIHHEDEQPRPWTCDLCGTQFQRVTVSREGLRRKGIHDYCPRCGLAPSDTDCAEMYAKRLGGRTPEWYNRLKAEISREHLAPGARPRYDPKSDDAYDAERERERVDRMKKEAQDEARSLAQAKRVAV